MRPRQSPRTARSAFLALFCALIAGAAAPAAAERPQMLQSPHYRIYFAKEHEQTAGEILEIAESVWPTLAKAYDAYDNYQVIDIFLTDHGDVANGSAIYPFSRVEIFLSHLNWVMRGRRNWLGNVVTHELAHVFTLRRKARLWIFSDAIVNVNTYDYDNRVSWGASIPWVPLVAPTWWVEGVAQFEAEAAGHDTWDSQRDMIVRDAWLTGTLPTLGQIETFDGDWVQAERTYNTGFAFLRWLRDAYGLDKVRALAVHKPVFHFGGAVRDAFGKTLPDLYEEWKVSLATRYASFSGLGRDESFDPDIKGSFTQSLAFSRDGRTMAWLGNDDRQYALNWIYWKDVEDGRTGRSGQPLETNPASAARTGMVPGAGSRPGQVAVPNLRSLQGGNPALRPRLPVRINPQGPEPRSLHPERSREFGSAGLEFNLEGTRLLTTRNDLYSPYSDLWEYEFRARKPESEKWHRLTWNERATDAGYHPLLPNTVVFVKFDDGSSNVAILDSTGRVRQLTRFREGQQVYNPRFTPRGDSIYFSLGIGRREALVAVSASARAWDPFAAIRDSSAFPDSSYLAAGERFRFLTPLAEASYRDLRFSGDTLLVSTQGRDSVYNVFARVPGDSTLYRLTRNRTQALEPQIRGGYLYYQGYRRQQFGLFRAPAILQPEGSWPSAGDTLAVKRPKPLEYSKAADSREPGVKKVAWSISPFLDVSPLFFDDSTFNLYARLGLNVTLGSVAGGFGQYFTGYLTKELDVHSPMSYGVGYGGSWAGVTAWHQKYGWTPNLTYGFQHDVVNYPKGVGRDTVVDGVDQYARRFENMPVLTNDLVYGFMSLPLDGMRVGPGYLGTSWFGRFYNRDYSVPGTIRWTQLATGISETQNVLYEDGFIHRHLFQEATLQWYVPAIGTKLPQGIGFYGSLAQWWTRYVDGFYPTDEIGVWDPISRGEPIAQDRYIYQDFSPWQVNFGTGGSYSFSDKATLSLYASAGFFTHKVPTIAFPALDTASGDTVTVSYMHPYLSPLSYRIAHYQLAYPYRFFYRGRDIMEGSAAGSVHARADFPLKIRQYFDYPSALTSLNKFELSIFGDATTVLNRTPDKLLRTLANGEHYLLMDYGAKISATFLMYHWLPMELYALAVVPYNQLKASHLYVTDLQMSGYTDREQYIEDHVKQVRYFLGFTFGGF